MLIIMQYKFFTSSFFFFPLALSKEPSMIKTLYFLFHIVSFFKGEGGEFKLNHNTETYSCCF